MSDEQQTDRYGLSTDDWKKVGAAIAIDREFGTSGLIPRVFNAVRLMLSDLDDAHDVLDRAGVMRGQPGDRPLMLGTRIAILAHLRDKATKPLADFGAWLYEQGYTLFDTTIQPLDAPDYPEVDLTDALQRYQAERKEPAHGE